MSTALQQQTGAVRACVFGLAGQMFAVDVRYAREVVIFEDHTRVPLAPPYLLGLANLRGSIVPILDIQPILGLPAAPVSRRTATLVIADGPLLVAVLIEDVIGLESFNEVIPLGQQARNGHRDFAIGLLRRGDGVGTLLNVRKIIEALRIGAPAAA